MSEKGEGVRLRLALIIMAVGIVLILIGSVLLRGSEELSMILIAGGLATIILTLAFLMTGEAKEPSSHKEIQELVKGSVEVRQADSIIVIFILYAAFYILGYKIDPLALLAIVAGWAVVSIAAILRKPYHEDELSKDLKELKKSVRELSEKVKRLSELLEE